MVKVRSRSLAKMSTVCTRHLKTDTLSLAAEMKQDVSLNILLQSVELK